MGADQSDTKGGRHVPTISRQTVPPDHSILTADGMNLPFRDIETGRAICCPFHHDTNASAFVLLSHSGSKGLHCSTCAQTFWVAGSTTASYDFFDFDKAVHKVQAYFEKHQDHGPLHDLFPGDHPVHRGLIDANITITSDRYLRIGEIKDGLTFIKSPKGTGKTEQLKRLIGNSRSSLSVIASRSSARAVSGLASNAIRTLKGH